MPIGKNQINKYMYIYIERETETEREGEGERERERDRDRQRDIFNSSILHFWLIMSHVLKWRVSTSVFLKFYFSFFTPAIYIYINVILCKLI